MLLKKLNLNAVLIDISNKTDRLVVSISALLEARCDANFPIGERQSPVRTNSGNAVHFVFVLFQKHAAL